MIVDCPHCHTSNATDGEDASETTHTGVGTMVVCRGCARHFHAPNQVNEVGGNTTQVVLSPSKEEHSKATAVVTVADLRLPPEGSEDQTNILGSLDGPTTVGAYPKPPAPEVDIQPHDPTSIMQAGDLQAELRRMKAERMARDGQSPEPERPREPEAPRKKELSPRAAEARTRSFIEQYPFLEQWVHRARLARRIFMEQSLSTRALLVGGGLATLLLLGVVLRLLFSSHSSGAFLAASQPLLTEPAHGNHVQRAQGTLQRGQQLVTFDEVGTYIMVRDMQGRVGYVMRDSLLHERPASQPDTPFVDCMSAAVESDRHGCETRGDEQWDSCRSWCEKGNGTDKCTDDCRGQYELCRATCRGEAVRPEPSPPPPPRPEPPPAPPRAESPPAPRPAETHVSKPAAKPKKTSASSSSDKKHKR